jgi:NADPH2:quinone reductase
MQVDEVEVGEPGKGQVRIRHTAIGVNFVDTYQRSGLYPMQLPAVGGNEAAGVPGRGAASARRRDGPS